MTSVEMAGLVEFFVPNCIEGNTYRVVRIFAVTSIRFCNCSFEISRDGFEMLLMESVHGNSSFPEIK